MLTISFAELPLNKRLKGKIVYETGEVEEARFEKIDDKTLFIFVKGKRSWGYKITNLIYKDKRIVAFMINENVFSSPAECYVNDVIRYKNYFEKYSHPNLWQSIREELKKVTPENIERFRRQNFQSRHECWYHAPEFGLPRIEEYKTLTLTSCGWTEHEIAEIRQAIDKKEKFNSYKDGRYDYSVNLWTSPNGEYCGSLAVERKGKGNGDYYILISENNALFAESD
ncbi:MAG: hypothetical protein QXG39_07270 [Candidatus Aenigmatarchaeota archaeon]